MNFLICISCLFKLDKKSLTWALTFLWHIFHKLLKFSKRTHTQTHSLTLEFNLIKVSRACTSSHLSWNLTDIILYNILVITSFNCILNVGANKMAPNQIRSKLNTVIEKGCTNLILRSFLKNKQKFVFIFHLERT